MQAVLCQSKIQPITIAAQQPLQYEFLEVHEHGSKRKGMGGLGDTDCLRVRMFEVLIYE